MRPIDVPSSIWADPASRQSAVEGHWSPVGAPCPRFCCSLAPNACVVADNMIFPPSPTEQAAYKKAVRAKSDMESLLLPIGGLEISKKRG